MGKPLVRKPRSREDWERFAEEITDKVAYALDEWCGRIHDDPLHCYSAHADLDLYELAEEFAGWSASEIEDTDLELLRDMPGDVYRKYSRKLQDAVEDVVYELEREAAELEEET